MKYILKFNESVSQSNYITQSDFDRIEDIFLFWTDEGGSIRYFQEGPAWIGCNIVQNSKIKHSINNIKIEFAILDDNGPIKPLDPSHAGRDIGFDFYQIDRDILTKEIGVKHPYFHASFSLSTIDDVNKLFSEIAATNRQEVLQYLDLHYDVKEKITKILSGTKGLDYYGFQWTMNLKVKLLEISIYESKVIFEVYIGINIKK